MPRPFSYLLGPELYWAVVCLIVHLATKRGQPPNPAVTSWLDDHWGWLPFILTPLTFAFLFLADTGRWGLLLRIDLAILIGLFAATYLFVNGMTYHQPSSGSGAGMAFLVIPIFGYCFALVLTLIAALIIWWRSRGHS
jgi:hypothetical protein